MCGIIGVAAFGELNKKQEKIRQEAMIFIATELLIKTQVRGKDATGIATLFADGDFIGQKMGIPAEEFVARFGGEKTDYEGYAKIWRNKAATVPAKVVIGHCRKPSTGKNAGAEYNTNNHPIKVGNIVGVHNGTLKNDEKIFKNLDCSRDGKVDSEAIFRLLHHLTRAGNDPFTMPALVETCNRLEGEYAVLAFNGNNPFQLVAFRDGRPLEMLLIKPLKLLVFASEKDFIKVAMYRFNKAGAIYNSGFPIVKQNDVVSQTIIDKYAYIFDLRREITAESTIVDTYTNEALPKDKKIWGSKVAKVHEAWRGNSYSVANKTETNNEVKKTQQPIGATEGCSTTETKDNEKLCRIGMAYSRKIGKFENVSSNGQLTREHRKTIEIDVEDGTTKNLTTGAVVKVGEKKQPQSTSEARALEKHQSGLEITESNTPADNLIGNKAIVKEIEVKLDENPVFSVCRSTKNFKTEGSDKEEIDLAKYPDVLERAVSEARNQPNFSNDEEMFDNLEIGNKEAVKHMSLYSFANRVKKSAFRDGWRLGYIACMQDKESGAPPDQVARTMLLRSMAKLEKAKTAIRTMKGLTKLLESAIPNTTTDWRLKNSIDNLLDSNMELDLDALEKIFKEGDLRNHKNLKKVLNFIKENRKKRKDNGETETDSSSI